MRALKNRYGDSLKTLVNIGLRSKDWKERAEAVELRKNIENYNFVVCVIIWERILNCLHRISQQLQAISTDLSASVRLLSAVYGELQHLHDSWDSILLSADAMSSIWGIKSQFIDKRNRRTKLFHDELAADCRLTDPNRQFQVDVFYKLLDVAINQLRSRFQGQQQVSSLFTFLFSGTMLRLTDIELETPDLIWQFFFCFTVNSSLNN